MKQATLYYTNGSSDKIYQASIDKVGTGFAVNFAYGRRGSALKTGSKTSNPVSMDRALVLFEKLVKSKKSKGYTEGENGTIFTHSDKSESLSGISCQLLNFVSEKEAHRYLSDEAYCAQAKHDGERRLIERKGDTVLGVNKKSLYVNLSTVISNAALELKSANYIIDGEDMGDLLVAFDLLEYDGNDIRHLPYFKRYALLKELAGSSSSPAIRVTQIAVSTADKKQLYQSLQSANHEGVVFKRLYSVWSAGRPNSGGDMLKYKFYDECTLIVSKVNEGKRSVAIEGYNNDGRVALGNVTIPPNKNIPEAGAIIEVRYLYAYPNGSLYQPLYLRERNDSQYSDCNINQLKYKTIEIAA